MGTEVPCQLTNTEPMASQSAISWGARSSPEHSSPGDERGNTESCNAANMDRDCARLASKGFARPPLPVTGLPAPKAPAPGSARSRARDNAGWGRCRPRQPAARPAPAPGTGSCCPGTRPMKSARRLVERTGHDIPPLPVLLMPILDIEVELEIAPGNQRNIRANLASPSSGSC